MVDYEKGTPSWDISAILTRHQTLPLDDTACARVVELRSTALSGMPAQHRLERALNTECSCGVGDSDAERTSLRQGGRNAYRSESDDARNWSEASTP